jgi:hypothetical protein
MAEAASFKKKAYVGDKLLDLWNCVAGRMHDRTDENGNRLPGTPEEVLKKAEEFHFASKRYRGAYRAAFGVEAFKPYTHATHHLHQFQLKLQYEDFGRRGFRNRLYGAPMCVTMSCPGTLGRSSNVQERWFRG